MDCEDLLSGPSGVDSATARTGRARVVNHADRSVLVVREPKRHAS